VTARNRRPEEAIRAGHCFLPADGKATHGPGADYDAWGVTVQVCVENCEGNFRTDLLVGTLVNLGKVAYARQTNATGDEDVGNDFGVVEIPPEAVALVIIRNAKFWIGDSTQPRAQALAVRGKPALDCPPHLVLAGPVSAQRVAPRRRPRLPHADVAPTRWRAHGRPRLARHFERVVT
jgi:hypothetical protein